MTIANLHIFPDYSGIAGYSANQLIELTSSGEINIALSGGNTPKKIFPYLVDHYASRIKWKNVNFFWVDERCVPPDHPDSNYLMTKTYLLDPLGINPLQINRIYGENDPEIEAERYGKILDRLPKKNSYPVFDMIFLGLGEDGHTASIFPGQMDFFQSKKYCEQSRHPVTGQKRITLTGPVINHAKRILFWVTGNGKSSILNEIKTKTGSWHSYPASYIHPENGILTWLVDQDAATTLVKSG